MADLCTAMASQALMGNHGHFNAFLFEAKPHPGMIESARQHPRAAGRARSSPHDAEERRRASTAPASASSTARCRTSTRSAARRTSPARCATRSSGSSAGSTIEINSSDDNPLFDAGAGRVQSGGNFYGCHITQAMDSLKVALANMADLIDRQLELWSTRSSTRA